MYSTISHSILYALSYTVHALFTATVLLMYSILPLFLLNCSTDLIDLGIYQSVQMQQKYYSLVKNV